MGSKVRQVSQEKIQGKVYTPNWVVKKILDEIGFRGDGIIEKFIVDPACGDGQFLNEVVTRVVNASRPGDLSRNLKFIYGWDIDDKAITACKEHLDKLIPGHLRPFDWNVSTLNPLHAFVPDASIWRINTTLFDYVIGNPPYIRIQHLAERDRAFIVSNYRYCRKGATDIFYAFFELGLSLLESGGKIGFIVPNSFLTSNAGAYMRNDLAVNYHVSFLSNFGAQRIFPDASTYNAIVIIENSAPNSTVIEEAHYRDSIKRFQISSTRLKEDSWVFSEGSGVSTRGMVPLSQVCEIHVGVTTLADKVYVIQGSVNKGGIKCISPLSGREYLIERGILKRAIKASRGRERQRIEWIIWPYLDGSSTLMTEELLRNRYPNAFQYLVDHRVRLDARDNGRPVGGSWFAFGRSQALTTVFGEKIVFPPMSARPEFWYESDPDAVIYSGYFIKYAGKIELLLSQLMSSRMKLWQEAHGRDFRGGWKSQSKSTIANFPVPKELAIARF
jgi:adenine-specific DNA-methyltransferase